MRKMIDQLYRTKMILTGLSLTVVGILLLIAAQVVSSSDSPSWAELVPWNELGEILVGAGILGIWIDAVFKLEQQQASEAQLRQLLDEHAPIMRDAVLHAFAADEADLERVATPATLDQIITNSLGLRLKDKVFAAEVFTDIRDQVIDARERWTDASLSINVNPAESYDGYLDVTYRWEYTTIPKHPERRFICLSDRHEYGEIANSRSEVSPWFFKPKPEFAASDKQAFELLRFSVNGEDRSIKRSSRKAYQEYSVFLGNDVIDVGEPVTICYTTRTLTPVDGHLLFFDVEQPTRDLSITFDYTGTSIDGVSAIDLFQSMRPSRIEHTPDAVQPKTLRVEIDGWVFPRSGVAFVWALEKETASTKHQETTRPISERSLNPTRLGSAPR